MRFTPFITSTKK